MSEWDTSRKVTWLDDRPYSSFTVFGEQKPIQTLKGFVDTVWREHTGIHNQFAKTTKDRLDTPYDLLRFTKRLTG